MIKPRKNKCRLDYFVSLPFSLPALRVKRFEGDSQGMRRLVGIRRCWSYFVSAKNLVCDGPA